MSLAEQVALSEEEVTQVVREADREAQATGALLSAWKDLAPHPRR